MMRIGLDPSIFSTLKRKYHHDEDSDDILARVGSCLSMAIAREPGFGVLVEIDRAPNFAYDAGSRILH